jgi:hypothetical protein
LILTKRLAVALGLGTILIGGAFAAPANRHDGVWSVQLATDSGTCDSSSTYSIAVENGSVRYIPAPGSAAAVVSGRISPDGMVDLDIRRSIAKADASGRLNSKSGAGTWQLSMLGCSGRWTAQKHSGNV